MSDVHTFLRPPRTGRLRVSHRRHLQRFDPAPGVKLVWAERVVTVAGPHAFRITVPVAGAWPVRALIERILEAIRDLEDTVPAAARGGSITSVDGHVRPSSGPRACLVLSITWAGPGDDLHRDAAQISGLVRNAARSCR